MKNFKNIGRRSLSLLLSFVMCLSMLPGTALAEDDHDHGSEATAKFVCQHGDPDHEVLSVDDPVDMGCMVGMMSYVNWTCGGNWVKTGNSNTHYWYDDDPDQVQTPVLTCGDYYQYLECGNGCGATKNVGVLQTGTGAHNYVNGVCACGTKDPDFTEPTEHEHDFSSWGTDGNQGHYKVCACGVKGELEQHNVQDSNKVKRNPATCTEAGNQAYYYCPVCDHYIVDGGTDAGVFEKDEWIIPAKGHDYAAKWNWADDYSSATATLTCKSTNMGVKCTDTQEVKATIEVNGEVNTTTCEAKTITYKAKVTYTDVTGKVHNFSDERTKTEQGTGSHKIFISQVDWIAEDDVSCEQPVEVKGTRKCTLCNYVEYPVSPTSLTSSDNGTETTYTATFAFLVENKLVEYTSKKTYANSAFEHDFVEIEAESTEGTCLENAKHVYKCSVCDKIETEDGDLGNHSLTLVPAKAATCGEAGNKEYWECEYCHKKFADEDGTTEIEDVAISATGEHTYSLVLGSATWTSPSCKDDPTAIADLRCDVCKRIFKNQPSVRVKKFADDGTQSTYFAYWNDNELLSALGVFDNSKFEHQFKETEAKVPATCVTEGKTAVLTCTVCGKTEGGETIPATGHNMVETAAEVPATCVAAGKTAVLTCANGCGKTEGGETIPATGHAYKVEWTWVTTCVSATPTAHVSCTTCGLAYDYDKEITLTGVQETPDSTVKTFLAGIVLDDGNVYQSKASSTGHNFSGELAAIDGEYHGTKCVNPNCDEVEKQAHNFNLWTSVTEEDGCIPAHAMKSTCEDCGYVKYNTTVNEHSWTLYDQGTDDVHYVKCANCGRVDTLRSSAHSWNAGVVKVPATCTSPAKYEFTCGDCGRTKVETAGEALGHDYGAWTITTAPTETEQGVATRVCGNNPQHVETLTLPRLGTLDKPWDGWTVTLKTAATCTTKGVNTWTYSQSGTPVLSLDVEFDALGHNFKVEWDWDGFSCISDTIDAEFTCQRDGCDESFPVGRINDITLIGETSHDMTFTAQTKWEGKVYTDTKTISISKYHNVKGTDPYVNLGATHAQKCADCGKSFNESAHTYSEDWTEQGTGHVHKCTAYGCDAMDSRESHEYTWTLTKEPTANEDGTAIGICGKCGHEITKSVPFPSENDGVWTYFATASKSATCEDEGYDVYRSIYGELKVTVKALGHDLTEVAAKEPTCTEDGNVRYYVCNTCGKYFIGTREVTAEDVVLNKTGHDLTEVAAKEPTCTENGNVRYYVCETCGKFFIGTREVTAEDVVLNKTGHDYGNATCTKPATCSRCGNTTGAALGHTVVIDNAVAPTCTASGLTEGSHCSVCGETIVPQTTVDALGHTAVVDNAVAPTCIATGLTEGSHCSVCGEIIVPQTTVDALGHTAVVDAAVAPTCT
ncbi:MAG: hypothetical protein HDT18_07590, partial [Oscillibacter sp.]|nr:hypothetical protein [Oscillibacter sp.]